MKKIFTLTIVSLMLILTIVNSCSKSSDTPAATTTTTTPPATVTYPDSNTLIVDGVTQEIFPANCSLSGGSSHQFNMNASNSTNDQYIVATTYYAPDVSKDYNVTFAVPTTEGNVQLELRVGVIGAQISWFAVSGTAKITIATPPLTGIKVSFKDLVFSKSGKPDKKISATMLCQ